LLNNMLMTLHTKNKESFVEGTIPEPPAEAQFIPIGVTAITLFAVDYIAPCHQISPNPSSRLKKPRTFGLSFEKDSQDPICFAFLRFKNSSFPYVKVIFQSPSSTRPWKLFGMS
jgi:hypothetical protein